MAKQRRRKKNSKLQDRRIRIIQKRHEIEESGNEVVFSEDIIESVMKDNNITNYKIDAAGNIRIISEFDTWIIETDGCVVFLYHSNKQMIRGGNERSSYHLHNVFYDLAYATRVVKQHDEYQAERYGRG